MKTMHNVQSYTAGMKAWSEERHYALKTAKEENALLADEQETLRDALEEVDEDLQLTKDKLEDALGKINSMTPWVDILGKKGQQYDVFIVETGLQLMGLGLTAPQAVFPHHILDTNVSRFKSWERLPRSRSLVFLTGGGYSISH